MRNLFLLILMVSGYCITAQSYTVGSYSITYTDPSRSNRSVGVEFRYPGTNAAVANGQFPFVIFAHGFQMDQIPYYSYADSLAKQGYIVGLLTTETALFPSHSNFAQDLIFVHDKLINESSNNGASFFYQKVIPKGALGGHSMGGGSTVLSAQYGNPATCYFTFAAANTNPSSIAAAPSMTKPYLAFAGSRDCIAPIGTHQQPMYDASGSACKFLINVTDGLHCQFGNGNTQCNLGEGLSFCASSPLNRTAQINKTLYFLVPYLDYYLKGDCNAWNLFESRFAANTSDVMQRNCTNIVPSNAFIEGDTFFCQTSSTNLRAYPSNFSYTWNNNSTDSILNVSSPGGYSLVVSNGVCSLSPISVNVVEYFPPSTPTTIAAPDMVCSGIININLSVANDPNALSYNWTLPDGWSIISGGNTYSVQVASGLSGGTISVNAENTCGVSDSVVKLVSVVPSTLSTPVGISGADSICVNGLQVLSFVTQNVTGADSLLWSVSGTWTIVSGQGTDSIVVYPGWESCMVSVSAVNACGISMPQTLLVTVLDTSAFSIIQQGAQLASSANGTSYQWFFDGLSINGENNQVITPSQSGIYSMVLTDVNGCSATSAPFSYVLNSIEEPVTSSFEIFPNPNSSGVLDIYYEKSVEETVMVTDFIGRKVLFAQDVTKHLDISFLPTGVYIVSLVANGKRFHRKLVVE